MDNEGILKYKNKIEKVFYSQNYERLRIYLRILRKSSKQVFKPFLFSEAPYSGCCWVPCSKKNYYLQLFYREVKEIIFYQGFPRPIVPTKYHEHREMYLTKFVKLNVVKIHNFLKKLLCTIISFFKKKMHKFFDKKITKRAIILLNCPKGRKVT